MSKIFDPVFMKELPGSETPKPKNRSTNWWRSIIKRIETQQFERWTETGCVLLNFAYDEQLNFEKKFKQIKKNVNKFWEIPDHNNICLLINEAVPERGAIAGFAYKRIKREKRNKIMANAVGEVMSISKFSSVIVIGVDVERDDYPYSVAACHITEDEDHS